MSLLLVEALRCLRHSCMTPHNMPLIRRDCDNSVSTHTVNVKEILMIRGYVESHIRCKRVRRPNGPTKPASHKPSASPIRYSSIPGPAECAKRLNKNKQGRYV